MKNLDFASLGPRERADLLSELWWQGKSIAQIAAETGRKLNSIGSDLHRARLLLGAVYFPKRLHRSTKGKVGPSGLNHLRAIGDTVTLDMAKEGSRQNVYQNAETRGWHISLTKIDATTYRATAISRLTSPETLSILNAP